MLPQEVFGISIFDSTSLRHKEDEEFLE